MLFDPNTVNAINFLLGLLVVGMMGTFWLRDGRTKIGLFWFLAACAFELGHTFYLLRPWFSFDVLTICAATVTSLALLCLLVSMQMLTGRRVLGKVGIALLATHLLALGCSVLLGVSTEFRMVLNSFFWGGLASAAFWCLHSSDQGKWRAWYGFPAAVVGAHAVFHVVRLVTAGGEAMGLWNFPLNVLQSISFSETSIFMVAIFMSLLISDLRRRNRELQSALDEVQVLSGMLPICSGCKKIRDDEGYWTKLETFISSRSRAQFSHGLCPDCAVNLYPEVFSKETPDQMRRICLSAKVKE